MLTTVLISQLLFRQTNQYPKIQDRPMIAFTARTITGAGISRSSFTGRSSVMFVFCSCIECRRVADQWAKLQKKNTFEKKEYLVKGKQPVTYVVYLDDAVRTSQYQTMVGLRNSQMIPDPMGKIAGLYRAMPCPTVFVVDPKGIVRYASKEVAGELVSDSNMLIDQTLSALRSISAKPNSRVAIQAADSKPQTLLSPVVSAGLRLSSPSEVTWEAMLPQDAEFAERTFSFVNRSSKPVKVESVLGSCGCQSVELIENGVVVHTVSVLPGKQVSVRARVTLASGQEHKSVSVWLYGSSTGPIGAIRIEVSRIGTPLTR